MEVRYQVFIKARKPNCILVKVESNCNVNKCLSMIPIHQEMNANSTLKLQPPICSLSLSLSDPIKTSHIGMQKKEEQNKE